MIRVGINVLPDDVLLDIFDCYMAMDPSIRNKERIEEWQLLVRVCRRWRSLVFGSPSRLNLRLYCTPETPAKYRLDAWPALPLIIAGSLALTPVTDNIIPALGQSNRIREVLFSGLVHWQLEKILAAMQVPFPELTDLVLYSIGINPPAITDSFLGGSAPRLRIVHLSGIPCPGLPKLLLSATHLVHLDLSHVPHSGYISPEVMVTCLSVLSSLESLILEFECPESRPDRDDQSLPPPKRFILPALDKLHFKGVTEYLEELVTRIDAPKLYQMQIIFFNQIDFTIPRLAQFINRTQTLRAFDEAHVRLNYWTASIRFRYQKSKISFGDLRIDIPCEEPDWQISSIEQVCNSSLHSPSTVEDLYIDHRYSQLFWEDGAIENNLWLQLLLPFTAVKNLYLSKEFAPSIAAALYESRITEVLASLQNIFVEMLEPSGPFQEFIGHFVAARQLRASSHPISISVWEKESD